MKYANLHGYSDIHPYEVIKKVSGKTIELRRMNAELDPSWKPEIAPGGFAGHCSNQNEQRWAFSSDDSAPVIRARLRKDGHFHSAYGKHVLADKPRRFYDYNF